MRAVDFVRALQEAYELGAKAAGGLEWEEANQAFRAHQQQAAIAFLVRKYAGEVKP